MAIKVNNSVKHSNTKLYIYIYPKESNIENKNKEKIIKKFRQIGKDVMYKNLKIKMYEKSFNYNFKLAFEN